MIEYDTLPFKTFYKILKDEKANLHLLGEGEDNEKVWERIKEQYRNRHPSPKMRSLMTAFKRVLGESIKLNRDITLMKYLLMQPQGLKELYSKLKLPWNEDEVERIKFLNKEIDKSSQKYEIFQAQLKKAESEIEEVQEEEGELDIAKLNEAIASLALVGFPINDFEKMTCGQYDAYSKVAERKARKQKNATRR